MEKKCHKFALLLKLTGIQNTVQFSSKFFLRQRQCRRCDDMLLMLEDENFICNSFLSVCMASWQNFMEIVWWEVHEILSFYKKNGYPFCDKKCLSLFGMFFVGETISSC